MKLLIASLTLVFSGTVFASDIQSCIVNMNRNTGLDAKDSSDYGINKLTINGIS